jgi:hypothetical protein
MDIDNAGASTADLVSPRLGEPQQAPEVSARAAAAAQLGSRAAKGDCTCGLAEDACHQGSRRDGDTSGHDARIEQLIADGAYTECRECRAVNLGEQLVAKDCRDCGERLGILCSYCCRPFLIEQLDGARRCEDCADEVARIAKREKRDALIECYGAPRRGVEVY